MTEEALGVIRETLPLPAIAGRICPHPCESECARNEIDEAVNINSLERFAADAALQEKAQPTHKIYTAKVAIIGSGPAGLAAAYELTKMGYPVTVFEAMPMLGGMLRIGVPDYRLPKNVLDAQINYIRDMGVEFKTNTAIGKDITLDGLKKEGYQAVFFALGAQLSQKLDSIVLVTGDGDFVPLVEYLKAQGQHVEVIAFGKSASGRLRDISDDFIDLCKSPTKYLIRYTR
jgi:NADPH-dependent glutamate synthase beta subunit-like oxidoreductase